MRDLSIIIPAYNEQDHILECLFKLHSFHPMEIIVVDNGSTDATAELVDRWIRLEVLKPCALRLLRLPTPGKGAAVRTGMLAAKGAFCYMADCDLSTPANAIIDFLIMMRATCADVVVGSRRMTKSRVIQSERRALSGNIFHALTSLLLPEFKDTQCGFKMFTQEAAQMIFHPACSKLDGLAFDVEVLLEARRIGCVIVEMPVEWKEGPRSRVHILRDGIKMTRDLITLARRYRGRISPELHPSLPL